MVSDVGTNLFFIARPRRCGDDTITPDDWAALKGTHAYDIICSLGTRVERVFIRVKRAV